MSAHVPEPGAGNVPEPGAGNGPESGPGNTSRPQAGGVPPGETPPGESSTGSGAGPYRPLTRGWGKGPLLVICLLALACALFFLAYAIMLNV
ncbi:DUF6480 family protein [Streptomyces sp. NPDC023588]|uniref:DUF6480 family protein n=1 Tax=Streptomyces sp. NPDC023588 TaxID=3154907 RepID=UPI0034074239